MDLPSIRYKVERVDGFEESDTLRALQMTCFSDVIVYPESDGSVWWLATADHAPVGFASISRSINNPDYWMYLSSAGVLKDHRGNGLQRRLIRVRCRYAKSVGINCVVSDTVNNHRSANNLIACGFRAFQPEKPWTYESAHYWRREL